MARVVKIVSNSSVLLNIVTSFEDGSMSVKTIGIGDTVENLRYIENEEVKVVTGVVKDIVYTSVTPNTSKANPTDTFASDMKVSTVVIDASEQYQSNVINVPVMEIVEDEGVEEVTSVHAYPKLNVTLDITYTNNTTENKDLEVGDILDGVVIMSGVPGTADITGKYTISSFLYTYTNKVFSVVGFNLADNTGKNVKTTWDRVIRFQEVPHVDVSGEGLSSLAALINDPNTTEVAAVLTGDVEIPTRDDGKITTVMVPEGKTVTLDLNGHDLVCDGYALYSTGGTIIIDDSTGKGTIRTRSHKTYGALYSNGGKVIINSGKIDTSTDTDAEDPNYMYGVVLSNDAVLEMNGGEVHTVEASGASITNGTAGGAGAVFKIGGDAKLTADACYAVYLADNKAVQVTDNAVVEGICARMGDIIVDGNGVVHNNIPEDKIGDFGAYMANYNGVEALRPGILVMAGMYNSANTGSNDCNVSISGNGKVSSDTGEAVVVCKVESKYNQKVVVDVAKQANLTSANGYDKVKVYEFEECAELAAASGKTITKTSTVDLTVNVDGSKVYPVEPVPNEEG